MNNFFQNNETLWIILIIFIIWILSSGNSCGCGCDSLPANNYGCGCR